MNEEAQRIAIAKACGWELRKKEFHGAIPSGVGFAWFNPAGEIVEGLSGKFGGGWHQLAPLYVLPDYLSDLNAMHKAERRFIGNAQEAMSYAMHLLRVCGLNVQTENDELNIDYCWHACNATAPRRAEAFLKTLGLWKEDA